MVELTISGGSVQPLAESTGAIARQGFPPGGNTMYFGGDTFLYHPPDGTPGYDGRGWEFSDEELLAKVKPEEEEKGPPPTTPNPHPPELIHDKNDAIAVSTSPDVCRSPTVAVPYPVCGFGGDDHNYASTVRSNGLIVKHENSVFTRTIGDQPGTGLGVRSNTVGDIVEPKTQSPIVRVEGERIIRHRDKCTLNNGNCPGEYIHVKSTDIHQPPDGNDEEDKTALESFWDQLYDKSGTVQGGDAVLDRAGDYWGDPSLIGDDLGKAWDAVPTPGEAWDTAGNIASGAYNVGEQVVTDPIGSAGKVWDWGSGALSDAWNGAKDAWNEDGVAGVLGAGVGAGIDLVNPAKKVKTAANAAEALDDIGDANKANRRRNDDDDDDQEENEGTRSDTEDGDPGARSTRRRNPCLHLAKGNPNGKGKFRGGSYTGTRGVGDQGMESDHIPPKSVSPLGEGPSPAIQKDYADHRDAMSTGSSREAKAWRAQQQALIDQGRYRDATAMDYRDTRRVAREAGDPKKYNEALRERSEYHKCLEEHGWLPGKK